MTSALEHKQRRLSSVDWNTAVNDMPMKCPMGGTGHLLPQRGELDSVLLCAVCVFLHLRLRQQPSDEKSRVWTGLCCVETNRLDVHVTDLEGLPRVAK